MIGICTDSNAQLPAALIDRFDVEVVPLTVMVDGVAHLEHVELDADAGAGAAAVPVRCRVGPSVGVHTGPGTAGVIFHHRPAEIE